MPRLIPLPDRDGVSGSSRLWINPDHIVTVAPIITRSSDASHAGEAVVVSVELKLEGVPVMRAWLGEVASNDAADVLWQKFLDQLTGRTSVTPQTIAAGSEWWRRGAQG